MEIAQFLAAEGGFSLPSGGEAVFWIIGAVVITGLWWMIRTTRKRAYDDYFKKRRAEDELRRNDPDLAKPDDN